MGLVTFNEAAKIVGRSRQTISNWAAKGIFKVKNIAGTNYIDEGTVRAFLDDLNDIEDTREKVERLRESVYREHEYRTSDMLDEHTRRRYYFVCGSGIRGNFFSIVVKMLMAYDTISEKQGAMLLDFLKGSTLEDVAKKYQCGRESARLTLEKAVRKGNDISKIADICNELKSVRADNEALKAKVHSLLAMVRDEKSEDNPNKELCELLSTSLVNCDLSVRALNICIMNNWRTIGDICKLGKIDILKARNVGKCTLKEFDELLSTYNLSWGMDVDSIYETRADGLL